MEVNSKIISQKSKSQLKIKKLKLLSVLICLIVALILLITHNSSLITTLAQQSPLQTTFSPNLVPLKTNEEKIIKLTLSSEGQISAFDLNFQTLGITIVKFENNLGFDTTVDPFSLKQVTQDLTNTNSRIAYILNTPTANLPKRIDLFIRVKGTTTGQAKITLDYNNSQVLSGTGSLLKINPNQEATYSLNLNESSNEFIDPASLPPLNYPDNTARINLKLKLYGAENQPQNLKAIAVAVGRNGASKYETQPQGFDLTPSPDGTFTGIVAFPNFRDGTNFSLMLKVDKYLLKRVCTPTPSESKPGQYSCTDPSLTIRQGENTFDFSGVALLPGDLGQIDGILNGYDLSLVRNNLNKNTKEATALADLNYDNIVNQKDFDIIKYVAANTNRESDQ